MSSLKLIRCAAILSLVMMLITGRTASASSFLTVHKVEVDTSFPVIKVFFSARNPQSAPLTSLNEDNITLYEDGYRVNYVKLVDMAGQRENLYLVFSIDTSKSVSRSLLNKFKESAKDILNRSDPGDRIALYRFNDEVVMLNNFASTRSEIARNIDLIKTTGAKTLLYNAVYDAVDFLGSESGERKSIIVFTDGRDEGSSVTADDIIRFARESSVPVNFICPVASSSSKTLARIAKLTGGAMMTGNDSSKITSMYSTIVGSMKNRYTLQYRSMLEPDGKQHQIELRLRHDTLRDRDSFSFTVPRSLAFVHLPPLSIVICALAIVLLIVLVLLTSLLFLRVRRRPSIADPPSRRHDSQGSGYSINLDDSLETSADSPPSVLSSKDPDYFYSNAWLVQKDGPETGKKFPIFWDQVTIGRDEQNTIVVKDQAVSPGHARIKKVDKGYIMMDLASDNGTFLNGKKLLRPKPLYDWDEIKIGRTLFIFRGSKMT